MIPVSNIICEYPLPLEEITSGEEDGDFNGIQWDELAFDTFSFFDENEFQRSSYLISEDGLFYEHTFVLELDRDENDKLVHKEVDAGLTRQDFTGQVAFGTEIFGKDYDYEIIFEALFFKGDLKELNLESFERKDNSARKELSKKMYKKLEKENRRKRNPFYLFVSAAKFTVKSLISIPKWILYNVFSIIIKLELWAKNK